MIAVDTNVLVRLVVDDPTEVAQVRKARALASEVGRLFVPQVVQVELVWVLTGAYGLGRDEVVRVLDHLDENRAFELQREREYRAALELYRAGPAGFADYLALTEAVGVDAELATFDKKLKRAAGAHGL